MPKQQSLRSLRDGLGILLKSGSQTEAESYLRSCLTALPETVAETLGVGALCQTTTPVELKTRLQQYLVQRVEQKRQRDEQRTQIAIAHAVATSVWAGRRVYLSPRAVLSTGLRANRRNKVVVFVTTAWSPVVVEVVRLRRASKALRFPDLVCYLDERGLNFRWRNGKGGLTLNQKALPKAALQESVRVVLSGA